MNGGCKGAVTSYPPREPAGLCYTNTHSAYIALNGVVKL